MPNIPTSASDGGERRCYYEKNPLEQAGSPVYGAGTGAVSGESRPGSGHRLRSGPAPHRHGGHRDAEKQQRQDPVGAGSYEALQRLCPVHVRQELCLCDPGQQQGGEAGRQHQGGAPQKRYQAGADGVLREALFQRKGPPLIRREPEHPDLHHGYRHPGHLRPGGGPGPGDLRRQHL